MAAAFPQFARARRSLLAAAMTDLLESFRPASLESDGSPLSDGYGGEVLSLTAYGTEGTIDGAVLAVEARTGDVSWVTSMPLAGLAGLLEDLRDGRGSGVLIGSEEVDVPADVELIELPMGPLLVVGTADEWQRVVDREFADMRPADELPPSANSGPWSGERQKFPVIESD